MAEKKKTTKKVAAKKPATKTVAKKAPAKKAPAKKTPTKKAVAKTTKKTATKTTTTKKTSVGKKSKQDYIDVINWKKWEAHNMDWLYIEINAGDIMTELEAGVNNLNTVCTAIMDCMLEGDEFIIEPKQKTKVANSLTVRYYCDNLSPERKKYSK